MEAYVVTGLGFGDEGKGTIVDWLARTRRVSAVVRYSGGPQCGHNVVTPDGRWHCFAQLGAASFLPEPRTLLAAGMCVELENLACEAAVLEAKGGHAPLARVVIDPECAVVTPMHKLIGQLGEVARGARPHGTCGLGVGEAVRDRDRGEALTVGELAAGRGLARLSALAEAKLARARELSARSLRGEADELMSRFAARCRPEELFRTYREVLARVRVAPIREELAAALADGPVICEGAQGALLDRRFGFVPHVTQSRTTVHPALELLGEAAAGRPLALTKIGVLRAYAHRHGAGPFVTEDAELTARLTDPRNGENRWQGPFRVGWPDLVALRHAVALNERLDCLAVTGLDRLAALPRVRVCTAYVCDAGLPELAPHFRCQPLARGRTRIESLRPGAHGPALTELMFGCRPLAWEEPDGAPGLVELLERELGVPVAVSSSGPDAGAKTVRRPDLLPALPEPPWAPPGRRVEG